METAPIGCARCPTDKQDLSAPRQILADLGVSADRICTDHGPIGTNRNRPELDQALAATRSSDTLVVPKLDRLARLGSEAGSIADQLINKGLKLALGLKWLGLLRQFFVVYKWIAAAVMPQPRLVGAG
jgi:DNA invertase Pin-like site-specific DNA recombinase